MSLYVTATERGRYLAETYRDRVLEADIGRSCVRFSKPEDVDLGCAGRARTGRGNGVNAVWPVGHRIGSRWRTTLALLAEAASTKRAKISGDSPSLPARSDSARITRWGTANSSPT